MLTREEERRLEDISIEITKFIAGDTNALGPTNEDIDWLTKKCLELNEELKNNCTGNEHHRHWSIEKKYYFWHSHPHEKRDKTSDFNSLHHHPPMDHRKNGN